MSKSQINPLIVVSEEEHIEDETFRYPRYLDKPPETDYSFWEEPCRYYSSEEQSDDEEHSEEEQMHLAHNIQLYRQVALDKRLAWELQLQEFDKSDYLLRGFYIDEIEIMGNLRLKSCGWRKLNSMLGQ